MAIVRWQPVAPRSGELDRLFSSFFSAPAAPAGPQRWYPPVDLVETDERFVLTADLPGLTEADVTVDVEDDVLTVSGERTIERAAGGAGVRRFERGSGRFSRAVRLPEGVDVTAIEASFANGVLEVRIPKPAPRVPHRVAITVGGTPTPAPETVTETESA